MLHLQNVIKTQEKIRTAAACSTTNATQALDDFAVQLAALERLIEIAQRDSHQPRIVAKFLLGLFNGHVYKFDLTDLRAIDDRIWADAMVVMMLDRATHMEIHQYIQDGREIFLHIAWSWGYLDRPYEAAGGA